MLKQAVARDNIRATAYLFEMTLSNWWACWWLLVLVVVLVLVLVLNCSSEPSRINN
ncbi:hypothetical protein [Paenibacillus odorifer]|uniref:hypothetical protein n=1 Tax=Paenibacillus odorifer TaxID=189426 RepID=UPI000A99C21E|nr:hypothetical protein [Paenibacillus odorifer]